MTYRSLEPALQDTNSKQLKNDNISSFWHFYFIILSCRGVSKLLFDGSYSKILSKNVQNSSRISCKWPEYFVTKLCHNQRVKLFHVVIFFGKLAVRYAGVLSLLLFYLLWSTSFKKIKMDKQKQNIEPIFYDISIGTFLFSTRSWQPRALRLAFTEYHTTSIRKKWRHYLMTLYGHMDTVSMDSEEQKQLDGWKVKSRFSVN